MADFKAEVNALIRDTRKSKGFTQKEMGAILGVTEATYGRYESGDANLSLDTVDKVAKALGVKSRLIFE